MKFLSFATALGSLAFLGASTGGFSCWAEAAIVETTASLEDHRGPSAASMVRQRNQLSKIVPASPYHHGHTDFHHRLALTLDVNKQECVDGVVEFAEYALTAALLAIPGFPPDLAPVVARAMLATVPTQDLADILAGFLEIENPTPADFATVFAELVGLLTQEGILTPDAILEALLKEIAALDPITQANLLFQLGLAFVGGGFKGTIDPNSLDLDEIITKALATVDVLLANCVVADSNPTPAPAASPETGIGFPCFSGESHVDVQLLESGEVVQKRMDALQIGDKVLTGDGSFSTIYSFGHKSADQWAEYFQIHTTASANKKKSTIEISKEHLIRVVVGQSTTASTMVPAQEVKVGDRLVSNSGSIVAVESIRQVQRRGAYAPLTATGDIVVGGVVASNYVSRSWLENRVPGQTLHRLQHGGALPYRLYCAAISSDNCHGETYDDVMGYSPWVMFWYRVEQWQLGLHPATQAVFLMMLAIPATMVVMVGMLLTAPDSTRTVTIHVLACLFGYYVWKKSQKKHDFDARVEKTFVKAE